MNYCDFCTCDDCKFGSKYTKHAQTFDNKWICDTCYRYSVCIDAKRQSGSTLRKPCDNMECDHRPQLKTSFEK
jgi:hypothetical protein